MKLTALFRGAKYDVEVEDGATAAALIAAVQKALAPAQLVSLKLLARGRDVAAAAMRDKSLQEVGVANGATLQVVASTASEAAEVAAPPHIRVKDDLEPTGREHAHRERLSAHAARPAGPGVHTLSGAGAGAEEYGFGDIRELKGLPDEEKAREVLRRIASDPGVLAVMRARRWRVPILSEMYPDGSVGVDPVCVLGLNKNMGQEICLRIRTDDLRGFRKYGIVLATVYHELAHNAISEHTGAFYTLVSEVKRQAEAGDWTRHGGHSLGGEEIYRRPDDVGSGAGAEVHGPSFEGGVGAVGGGAGAAVAVPGTAASRELAALAAQRRAAAAAKTEPGSGQGDAGHTSDGTASSAGR
jgi:hypothetical protein